MPVNREIDIARTIKVIEWLKADLVASVAALFKAMVKGSEELILDSLAGLVITCYVLGKRLGLNFSRLDLKVESRLRLEINEEHEVEKWYGDLSALLRYFESKKG